MYFSRVYLPHTAQVRYLYAAICSVLSMLQVICPVSQDERAKCGVAVGPTLGSRGAVGSGTRGRRCARDFQHDLTREPRATTSITVNYAQVIRVLN
jgi:hypothetical protein